MLRWLSPEVGELLINAVLSINEQTKHRYQDEINLASYSDIRPTLQTTDQISVALESVWKVCETLEGHRGEYLRGSVDALRCYLRLLEGDAIPYTESIRRIQQLPVGILPERLSDELRESLGRELGVLGFRGTVPEKIRAFTAHHRIAPDKVVDTAYAFLAKAREKTLHEIKELPQGEGLDRIEGVTGVYWSGFSQYTANFRGHLTFNIERPWSLPTFANVMTHETYPGHQAFYARWDALFQQDQWPLEAAYYFTGMPDNALFEGAPETALHFLDWDSEAGDADFSAEEKRLFRLGRDVLDLQRIYQTNACCMVNRDGASEEDSREYLMGSGLFTALEAENTHRFFTDPIQRTYYPCYFYGARMVRMAYDRFPATRREEFFRILYDVPHTTDTFCKAITQMSGELFEPFAGL